jgi:SWI/SNF chromatin-remodeling complex subunit SWI1
MNAWLSDASNIPNHDNGNFNNATIDPSMAFLQPSPTLQDPSQFQRMFNNNNNNNNNGIVRNGSPGFHNPNQVIPSKRPRPEEGMSMSPRQASGGLPASRSHTPHQLPFPGYQGSANGTPQFAHHPTPYQHLQQGNSVNTNQSPVMQEFDQHGMQRLQTASPSPFSSAGPPVANQISQPQSDQGSRVNTPQNPSFMPGQAFPQGMPAQFSPSPAMTSAGTPASMQAHFNNMAQNYPPQALAAQQQRLYQMQLQNQARQMQANNPAMMGRPGGAPMANPQMAAIRQMQQNLSQQNSQQNMAKPGNPDMFMKSLQKFMVARNLPLDLNPHVGGRPVNLVQLYATVIRLGGSKKVSAANMWPAIAQQMQYSPMQYPNAAVEIRDTYLKNLAPYEQAFLSTQQKQMEHLQQNPAQRQSGDLGSSQFQQSPVKASPGFEQQHAHQFTPSPQSGQTIQNNVQQSAANGFITPQQPRPSKQPSQQQQQQQQPTAQHQNQRRPSVTRQAQAPPANVDLTSQGPGPSLPAAKTSSVPPAGNSVTGSEPPPSQPLKQHIEDPFKPTVLPDNHRHGPIVVDEIYQIGEDITRLKPNVPSFVELGVIDIHALTMSVKSGIHAEMRVALDTLTTLSSEVAIQISLENCDDLVETLVECAEDQLDYLAEHAAEVSDTVLLPSYEEVVRGCRLEMSSLVDVPDFGSVHYELDRAVDRLLCITAIIRNFSFFESNFGILASPTVVRLFSSIIQLLGTRNMLLRTYQNVLDFMKDTVTYLSNIAYTVQLPGKEEALALLYFLLSFAPLPSSNAVPDEVMFTSYNPNLHQYTPTAIDSLAKILARDEPNRMYYKAIFSGDGMPSQNDLLTRAFGLAICPVPDQPRKPLAIAELRKVFLMQGLLAADILTGLADGSVSRCWLESKDGFAVHLLRLCCLLSTERVPPPTHRHNQGRGPAELDAHAYGSIINRGLSILRRLAEKSKQDDPILGSRFRSGVLPKRESLLGALLTPNLDPGVVRQLITYAGLGE